MSKLIRFVIGFLAGHWMQILQLLPDVLIIAMIILLIRKRNLNKQRQELIVREQKGRRLVERISNPEYLKREGIEYGRSYPYKISDGGVPVPEDAEKNDRMIDLSVQSLMLTRDFLLPVSNGIMIGRAENNTISIDNPELAEHQCRIYMAGDQICVETLSNEPTVILRGSEHCLVGDTPVALLSSDVLLVGENRVTVRF